MPGRTQTAMNCIFRCREPSRTGAKVARGKLVANFCRPRFDVMKAVVTHLRTSLLGCPTAKASLPFSLSSRINENRTAPGDTFDFALKGVDGKTYSLADVRKPKGTLVVFIRNHCPEGVALIIRDQIMNRVRILPALQHFLMPNSQGDHAFPAISDPVRAWHSGG